MMLLKTGVVLVGNKYTNDILKAVQRAYSELELDVTVTSGLEYVHSPDSYHGQGRALDFRIWGVPDKYKLAARIAALLPPYYDVVAEFDHIHVEADAKKELKNA